MIILPFAEIEEETLHRLLEELVTRDGTDYGFVETSNEKKIGQVLQQLRSGAIALCYDNETESCSVLPMLDVKRLAG